MYSIIGLRREYCRGPAIMVSRPFAKSPMFAPSRVTVKPIVVVTEVMKIRSALKIRKTLSTVLTVVTLTVSPSEIQLVLVREMGVVVLAEVVSDAGSTTA
jgi:hypothetical protein